MKNITDYSEQIIDEARRLENEGLNYKEAFKQALKEYADYCTDQSNSNHAKRNNVIISKEIIIYK